MAKLAVLGLGLAVIGWGLPGLFAGSVTPSFVGSLLQVIGGVLIVVSALALVNF